MKRLKEAEIHVNLLITVDTAAGPENYKVDRTMSENVNKNINYYQTTSSMAFSKWGKNSKEAKDIKTQI